MKKSKLNKFETQKLVNTSTIYGGNNSDVNYKDSKGRNATNSADTWDITVNTLVDVLESIEAVDNPCHP